MTGVLIGIEDQAVIANKIEDRLSAAVSFAARTNLDAMQHWPPRLWMPSDGDKFRQAATQGETTIKQLTFVNPKIRGSMETKDVTAIMSRSFKPLT